MKDRERVRKMQRLLTLSIWSEAMAIKENNGIKAECESCQRNFVSAELMCLADNWPDTTVPQ